MVPRFQHRLATLCVLTVLSAAACAGRDRQLQQHEKAIESLASTTRAITEGWLAGQLSGTYAQTALERTFALIEQERAAVGSAPSMLLDDRGVRLSETANNMAFAVAQMIGDVRTSDGRALRQHLGTALFHERGER